MTTGYYPARAHFAQVARLYHGQIREVDVKSVLPFSLQFQRPRGWLPWKQLNWLVEISFVILSVITYEGDRKRSRV
jgi:hypothetical protein